MIYSLTIAPAMDYTLDLGEKDLKVGATNRMEAKGYSLGGKGITVARMLNNLKVKNIPIVALGGSTGKQMREIIDHDYEKAIYLPVIGNSRLNVMITGPHQDTRFNAEAPKVTEKGLEKMFNLFQKHLKKDDIVILSGSLGQEDSNLYATLIKDYIRPAGAIAILDTTGKSLISALPYKPFMIKPNDEELADLLGKPMDTPEAILEGGEELKKMGPETVLVTMGRKGAYYFAEDGHVYHCSNAQGTQVSAVGAGDSSISGFIKGLEEGVSIEKRLQYSMAAGGATAFSEHLGSYKLWKSLLPQIKVTLVK